MKLPASLIIAAPSAAVCRVRYVTNKRLIVQTICCAAPNNQLVLVTADRFGLKMPNSESKSGTKASERRRILCRPLACWLIDRYRCVFE